MANLSVLVICIHHFSGKLKDKEKEKIKQYITNKGNPTRSKLDTIQHTDKNPLLIYFRRRNKSDTAPSNRLFFIRLLKMSTSCLPPCSECAERGSLWFIFASFLF